jgi:formiminoglutamase
MFEDTFDWQAPSGDPNDRQFGDVVDDVALADADDCRAVLVGESYDRAVIGRRGAGTGPGAIREHLAATKTHHFDAGPVEGADAAGGAGGDSADESGEAIPVVGDLGDVSALRRIQHEERSTSVTTAQDRVAEVTSEVHDRDALPLFLGGDNSMTVANARPLLERGSVGAVSLDAHLDCREVRGDATTGTPYRQLLEAGLDGFAVLGARHFETSTAYHDYVDEQGGEVVTAEEVGADPVAAVDRALGALAGVDHLFVSLDCDVLDAAAGPGVSAPTPGGLTSRELFRVLRLLAADDRLAGFEVVECAPPLDEGERTARTAARAVAHVLSAAGVPGGAAGVPDEGADVRDRGAGGPDSAGGDGE